MFYVAVWNETSSSFDEIPMATNELDLSEALYLQIGSISFYPNYANTFVSVPYVEIESDNNFIFMYNETLDLGDYNVTIYANDTQGLNSSDDTNFTIVSFNYPPSTPYVLTPYQNQVVNGMFNITWINSTDIEGDSLRYNITLLNPDDSLNATIITEADISTAFYQINSSDYADGLYRIRIYVYEDSTPEGNSNFHISIGTFRIANSPFSVLLLSPQNNSINCNGLVSPLFYETGASSICYLHVNGTIVDSISDTEAETSYFFDTFGLFEGSYEMYVNCSSAEGPEISNTVYFSVNEAIFEDTFTSAGGLTAQAPNTAPWERGNATQVGGCYDDSSCWGTGLSVNYQASGPYNSYLELTDSVDLTGMDRAILWFYHYRHFENANTLYDAGVVDIYDGSTWNRITPQGGYTGTVNSAFSNSLGGQQAFGNHGDGWELVVFNLTDYVGLDDVKIRYHFAADSSVGDRGWFIDKMRISECIEFNEPPTVFDVILEASTSFNQTDDDLTVYYSVFDLEEQPLKNITTWYVNGSPYYFFLAPFEGGSNNTYTKDYSGWGNKLTTPSGSAPTWNRTGGYDGFGAYEFTTDNRYLQINDTTNMPLHNFTFGAWVKPTSTHEIDTETNSLVDTSGISGQAYVFSPVHGGDDNMGVGVSVGTNGISVYEHGAAYMPAVAVYEEEIGTGWSHVVVVYSQRTAKIYLNGTLVHTGLTSQRDVALSPIQVGSGFYGSFSGTIDDAFVAHMPLSQEQIEQIYLGNHDVIVSNETEVDDVWQACVTVNDKYSDSETVCSNNVTILSDGELTVSLDSRTINDLCDGTFEVTFNCSARDTSVENVSLYITDNTNSSFSFNTSVSGPSSQINLSETLTLTHGNYTWNCLAEDSFGNTEWGVNESFELYLFVLNSIDIDPVLNIAYFGQYNLTANVSIIMLMELVEVKL